MCAMKLVSSYQEAMDVDAKLGQIAQISHFRYIGDFFILGFISSFLRFSWHLVV